MFIRLMRVRSWLIRSQCKALKDAGLTHILYEEDEQYKARTESYWSVSAQLRPTCIVQPLSTDEVSKALKTLVSGTKCNFAVRSGGHATWAGSVSNVFVKICV
jgi:hypothetical protein